MANIFNNILGLIGQSAYSVLVDSGFMARPIGIVAKNYQYMVNTLARNIGNNKYDFDGFGNSIGELGEPYFNGTRYVPWFKRDTDKARYSNYIRYVEGMRDMSLDLKASFSEENIILKLDSVKPLSLYYSDSFPMTGDTYGGLMNKRIGKRFLDYSATANSERLEKNKKTFKGHSISKDIYDYFGWNVETVKQKRLNYYIDTNTGRVSLPTLAESEDKDYGEYKKLVTYKGSVSSISDMQKTYIQENLERNIYTPQITFAVDDSGNTITSSGDTYLDEFGLVGYITPMTAKTYAQDSQYTGRYVFKKDKSKTKSTGTLSSRSLFLEYAEQEKGSIHPILTPVGYGQASKHRSFDPMTSDMQNSRQLLHTTRAAFENGKYNTIIARFHTDEVDMDDPTQTAVSSKYGMSHGRNLLKTSPSDENGYENPYCRVWTYHHQYARVKDQIRPFNNFHEKTNGSWASLRAGGIGGKRLQELGVRRESDNGGYVKITPNTSSRSIKNCMFSIENLAWKGVKDLSSEQRGPLGGRIMWFPPYDINFSEQVTSTWNGTKFIGRGEQIYTYVNTDRNGTLDFKLLIDHPSILDYWDHKNYQQGDITGSELNGGNVGTVDDINDPEQELLRFFAGCELLNVGGSNETVPQEKIESPESSSISDSLKELSFYVFYPNDYSGINDGGAFAMSYLINGVGTSIQSISSASGKTRISDSERYDVIPNVTETYVSVKGGTVTYNNCPVIGYEIVSRKNLGISMMTVDDFNRLSGNTNDRMYKVKTDGREFNIYTQRHHGHRVDVKKETDLKPGENGKYNNEQYLDLNSNGFNSGIGYLTAIQKLGAPAANGDSVKYVSFADMYAFLDNEYYRHVETVNGTSGPSIVVDDNVSELEKIFNDYDIEEIVIDGFASLERKSSNGKKYNKELAENRRKSVKDWLGSALPRKKTGFDVGKIKMADKKTENNSEIGNVNGDVTSGNHSKPSAKLARHAKVTIRYSTSKNTNFNATKTRTGTDIIVGNPDDSADKNKAAKTNTVSKSTQIMKATNVNGGNHDLEYQFFQKLSENSPLMRSRISDKIKYFDPAFHSVSPEGFNARLTFLHQCTRQGPTISASDSSIERTANNLSFGRPPVCVLRIGDFYYTRIVINSLNIVYEPMQWDLNDEGIGVMPMMAKVTLGFSFIGGSDLAGPIERLQNAVSFNYYANTGVYDKRADRVEYDEDGKIKSYEAYVPDMDVISNTQDEAKDAKTDDKSGNATVTSDETATSDKGILSKDKEAQYEAVDPYSNSNYSVKDEYITQVGSVKVEEEKKNIRKTQQAKEQSRRNSSATSSTSTSSTAKGKTDSAGSTGGRRFVSYKERDEMDSRRMQTELESQKGKLISIKNKIQSKRDEYKKYEIACNKNINSCDTTRKNRVHSIYKKLNWDLEDICKDIKNIKGSNADQLVKRWSNYKFRYGGEPI